MRPSQLIRLVLRLIFSFRRVWIRITYEVREPQEVELHCLVHYIYRYPAIARLVCHCDVIGWLSRPVGAEDEIPSTQFVHVRRAERNANSLRRRRNG